MGAAGSTAAGRAALAPRYSPSRSGKSDTPNVSAATPSKRRAVPPAPVVAQRGDMLRVAARPLSSGEMQAQDVGYVEEGDRKTDVGKGIAFLSPRVEQGKMRFAWFVEVLEQPGSWEPYSEESSNRLEEAFLSQQETCAVVMKKRSYTVDLTTMRQLPFQDGGSTNSTALAPLRQLQHQPQRARAVKRTPLVTRTDPITGEVKTVAAHEATFDPFAEEEEGEGDAAAMVEEHEGSSQHSTAEAVTEDGRRRDMNAGTGDTAFFNDSGADGRLPRLLCSVLPHTSPIYTMECTPVKDMLSAEARAVVEPAGGALVLSSGRDMQLLEWSIDSSTVVTRYDLPRTTLKNSVLTAVYSPSARWMIAGLDDCTARFFAIGNAKEIHCLTGHTHKVYGAAVLGGEERAATASMDSHVKLWDISTGTCLLTTTPHRSHIFSLRAHPVDPNFALTAGEDHAVCMHDFRQEKTVVATFAGHEQTVWDLDWHPSDSTFASCGMDCATCIFDARRSTEAVLKLRSHTRPVHSIRYTPRGRGLLSSSKDCFVHLADPTDGVVQWRARAHATTVFRVRYHADKSVMLTAASDKRVNVWRWNFVARL